MTTYGPIRGYRIGTTPTKSGEAECPRCGRRRSADANRKDRSGLCRDCSSGMTPEERKVWRR